MKSMKIRLLVLASLLASMVLALSACSGQEDGCKVSNRPQNSPADWEKKNITIDG